MNYCFFAVNSVSDVFLLIGLAIVSPVHDDVLIFKKNFMPNKSDSIKY